MQPYTYYRNRKDRRTFLLLECPYDGLPGFDEVWLIEWGRSEIIRMKADVFTALVENKQMELFTPKYQE